MEERVFFFSQSDVDMYWGSATFLFLLLMNIYLTSLLLMNFVINKYLFYNIINEL